MLVSHFLPWLSVKGDVKDPKQNLPDSMGCFLGYPKSDQTESVLVLQLCKHVTFLQRFQMNFLHVQN